MTVTAHVFPDYSPQPDPEPSIEAALNRMALYRTGIRSFTKAELQRDCLAYDQALRASIAERDELRAHRGAFTLRAVVEATADQQQYIAALEAVTQMAVKWADGDASACELVAAVMDYAEMQLGADT